MRLDRLIMFLTLVMPSVAHAECALSNLMACPSPLFGNVRTSQLNGAAPGTVSAFSVVPANGFAGTVATPETTPSLTLSTTVSGIVKGSGGGLSIAVPGTDYLMPNGSGAALTGITATQLDPAAANGVLFIGNGAGFSEGTINGGANVTVTNGPGTIIIAAAAAAPAVGVTGAIGGGVLAAGSCASGTVGVPGAASSSAVVTSPTAYPGDGFYWHGYVSSSGVVTVDVCSVIGGTPTASAYNVRVFQ